MIFICEVCKSQQGLLGESRFGSGQLIGRAGAGERHVLKFINCFFELDFASLTPSIIAHHARLRVSMCWPHMNYLLQAIGAGQVGLLLLPDKCLEAAKVEAGKEDVSSMLQTL